MHRQHRPEELLAEEAHVRIARLEERRLHEPGMIVANFVIPPEQATTAFARSRRSMQEKYLAEIEARFPVPVVQIPLLPMEVKGLDLLAELGDQIYDGNSIQTEIAYQKMTT
ncbi:MAG: ArsA-related P-loop ATPase [Anaerolineales bacterium]